MLRFKLGEIVGGKVLKPVDSFPDPSPTEALTPPSFWEMPFAVDLSRRVASFSTSQYPCLPHEIGFAAEAASLSCCSTRYMALVRWQVLCLSTLFADWQKGVVDSSERF